MVEEDLHTNIIDGTYKRFERFFEDPNQAVYLYLDDKHKACSSRFASLLGYESAQEWADVEENFPTVFVHGDSQRTLVSAYQKTMENSVSSVIDVTWKRKSDRTVDTTVFLAPVTYQGHRLAMHFVSERG